LAPAPKKVDTVVNCRVVNKTTILAGVSGGVRVEPLPLVAPRAIKADRDGKVGKQWYTALPKPAAADAWWWD
jgi:hypothetical protein